jgi:hypothetical protein
MDHFILQKQLHHFPPPRLSKLTLFLTSWHPLPWLRIPPLYETTLSNMGPNINRILPSTTRSFKLSSPLGFPNKYISHLTVYFTNNNSNQSTNHNVPVTQACCLWQSCQLSLPPLAFPRSIMFSNTLILFSDSCHVRHTFLYTSHLQWYYAVTIALNMATMN